MQDDEIERTLCQLPQVHVFRIPAQKSAEGHRASDWPKDPNWTGKLKIIARGKTAAIILSDDKNQVFAICQVTDDSAVQKVLDSGRYFVLRITNQQGRHAYIGIAFNERNDAFDFNVALSEFRGELEREEKASKFFAEQANSVDLTLKEGEKIRIKLNTKKSSENGNETGGKVSRVNIGALAPPPDMQGATTNPKSPVTSDPFGNDPFGWEQPHKSASDPFAAGSVDPFRPTVSQGSSSASHETLLDFNNT